MATTASKPRAKATKSRSRKRLHTASDTLQLAQKVARLRDFHGRLYATCISCEKPMSFDESQGGHYITRKVSCTSDDLDNINAQCARCNMMEGGNFIGYRDGLVRKIGITRVERLENMFRASRGDEMAMEALSPEDRGKVLEKRTRRYWDSRYQELKELYEKYTK